MRIAVIHNLNRGGAHRRLGEQLARFNADVVEVCLATAQPIRTDAHVIGLAPHAPRVPRVLRVPLRYADLAALLMAWRHVAAQVRELGATVVYANPCRYLQAPAALLARLPPALYFCDEPRRVDHDPSAQGTRNALTRPVYGVMYGAERAIDGRGVARAAQLATNSRFTADEIAEAYRRRAEIVPLGVAESFRGVAPRSPSHVLSVGTLIPSKGHDLAIASAARGRRRWPVIVVAPRAELDEARRLRTLAAAAGVALELRTGIPDGELAELYAGAQATLYLAAREPFGLASLEAQAAGSPVIVSAEGGLPETLAPEVRGWAVPREAQAVAAKLDQLERPELRTAVAAAGRAHAAAMSWDRSARSIETLLSELAGQ